MKNISEKIEMTNAKPPGKNPQQHTQRILCLWFPNWPIQRLVVSEPELRRQRIVLFRRDARRGQVTSAASPLAMQDGACVDMPLSEAKSLLGHGGIFHIFEHDFEADVAALERLADSLESFSPIIGLETISESELKRGHRPDSLLLEVTGLAHLFGDENQLARQLLVRCDGLGYLPRIAIADTVGIAWAMARYFAGEYFAQHEQPVVLPPGDQETIGELPVDALRLEAPTIDTLYQLGVETIGQLQRLSRDDLAMRFGNEIHRRLDQMTGKIQEPVIARRKPAEFIAEQLLEYPANHRETIEVIIARLVAGLCAEMRARQRGALEWTIRLICQSALPLEFRVNLFQPTTTTKQILPLVEMQLEQVLSPVTRKSRKKKKKVASHSLKQTWGGLPACQHTHWQAGNLPHEKISTESEFCRYTTIQVTEIVVSVTSDVLMNQQQRQLFDENPRLDRQALAHLINRLANRLGTPNVVYPSLQAGAQPEYSFRLRPLVDPRRKRRRQKTTPPRQSHTLARPFRLFYPPLRLQVKVGNGVRNVGNGFRPQLPERTFGRFAQLGSDRPPALFQIELNSGGNKVQRVITSCGPERIETGWWRGLTVCRDYWRIETETRQQFWVYRDLRSGNWFLHGEF